MITNFPQFRFSPPPKRALSHKTNPPKKTRPHLFCPIIIISPWSFPPGFFYSTFHHFSRRAEKKKISTARITITEGGRPALFINEPRLHGEWEISMSERKNTRTIYISLSPLFLSRPRFPRTTRVARAARTASPYPPPRRTRRRTRPPPPPPPTPRGARGPRAPPPLPRAAERRGSLLFPRAPRPLPPPPLP